MNPLLERPIVPASVLVLAFCLWQYAVSADRKRTDWIAGVTVIAFAGNLAAGLLVIWLSQFAPGKLDLYCYRIDAMFGQPAFYTGQFLLRHWWLQAITSVAYSLEPLAMAGTLIAYVWLRQDEVRGAIRTFAAAWLTLPVLYWLFPVCGPLATFPQFPRLPGPVTAHVVAIHSVSNAMPSGHMACALLILWFLRHWRWGQVAGGVFAVLTVLATLGTGHHWLVDLLAAVPYAAGVYLMAFRARAIIPAQSASANLAHSGPKIVSGVPVDGFLVPGASD